MGLKDAIAQLNKTYGEGTIITEGAVPEVGDRIKSGSFELDIALNGGYPKGRIVEIFGKESSGKTTLTLHAIADEQKRGGNVVFVDYEHAFDPIYAESLGVDMEKLIFTQPDNAEEGLEVLDRLIRTGEVSLAIVDSVAAMVPKSELDGEMGDANVGKHAKLMSQAMRKLTGVVSRANCCVIFINQIREAIGVMFGNPEVTTGGNALKFYSSQRLKVTPGAKMKEGDIVIGTETKVQVIKNKVGRPHMEATFLIQYGEGISHERDILRCGVKYEVIDKRGSWFSYQETKLGQGENAVVHLLKDNPDLLEEIKTKLNEVFNVEP